MICKVIILYSLVQLLNSWCLLRTSSQVSQISRIVYSPNRNFFATISDGTVYLYNALNHLKLAEFQNLPKIATDIDFSSNGSILGISFDNSNIQFYNTYTYALQNSFDAGHGNGDTYFDFNDDSDFLISCGGVNNKIKVWDMSSLTLPTITINQNSVIDCQFDSSNNFLVSRTNQLISYDSTGSQLWSNNYGTCQKIEVDPNRNYVVAACNQGSQNEGKTITIDGSSSVDLVSDGSTIRTASFSQDGSTIFYGGDSQIGYFFDGTSTSPHSLILMTNTDSDIVYSDFSQDGNYLLIGLDNGQILQYAKLCFQCQSGYYQNLTTTQCELCNQYMRACTMCVNSTFCTQCTQGFYVNQTTHLCETCQIMQGCSACLSSTVCTFCMPGFYLDNGLCKFCHNALDGCLRCIDNTQCEQCTDDYYLSSATKKCVSCTTLGGCALCSSSTYCSSCQIGFFNTNTGTCQACNTNCLVCEDSSTCYDCRQGFFPDDSGACVSCGSGCLSCNQTGFCFDCINNMYPVSGSCSDCIFPCDQCNQTMCLACTAGYYIDSGDCQPCDPPCVTCISNLQCLSCPLGYYLTSGSVCQSCENIQNFCQECTPTQCLNCTLGYYLNSSLQCTACSSNMFGCLTCTSISDCSQCSPGHYHTGLNGNDSCLACPLGCSICSGSSTCQACQAGYYISTTSCLKCADACQTCDSTACYQCQQTHFLELGACELCNTQIQFCLTCQDGNGTGTKYCTSCEIGSYLSGNVCQKCSNNCSSCDSLSSCQSCEIGYYISSGSCNLCPQNCTSCISTTNCSSCTIGFYLQSSSDLCLHCSQINCLTCNQTGHCLSCLPGYYITGTKQCSECFDSIDNCQICEDSSICTHCFFGYILAADSLSCDICSNQVQGCIQCSTHGQCDKCQNGYYLITSGPDTNKCGICPQGCTSCTQSLCQTCLPGYILDTGICKHCQLQMDGCQLCTDSSTCVQCSNGYFLNNGNDCSLCRSSIKGCQFCNSSSICTYCGIGFYLNGNSCDECELTMIGCQVCSNNSVCQMCSNGYYLSGTSCTLCQSISSGCYQCEDSSHCSSCIQGFYLDTSISTNHVCTYCHVSIQGCISCSSGSYCDQCEAGYYLKNSDKQCYACPNNGCELCYQNNLNLCHQCNTRYFLSSARCYFCKDYIEGCLECSSSSVCQLCETGYFINSTNDCQLCQQSLQGCKNCQQVSGNLQCIQCKSSYFLETSNNQCKSCFDEILGCAYCFDSSACEECASGYFLDSSTGVCKSCRQIDGCLVCSDDQTCILCKGDYFLQTTDDTCYPCSALQGCYSCTNNQTCKVCIGGYLLNDDKQCEIMAVSAGEGIQKIKFQSSYENQTTLSHDLLANQIQYDTSLSYSIQQWNDFTTITIKFPNFTLVELEIVFAEFVNKNDLKIYTNNPLNISQETIPTRRLLSALPDGYKTYIEMDQEQINQILPDLYMSKSLIIDYDLSSANFVKTFTLKDPPIVFSLIGITLVLILTINFILKAVRNCTKLPPQQHAQILPHVLALKAPAFILYPLFPEQISFCYGFMIAQFPWATDYFSETIGDKSQILPEQYEIFYTNMSLGSIYMLPFIIYILCLGGMWLYHMNSIKDKPKSSSKKQEQQKQFKIEKISLLPQWPLKVVFYNFFLFGLVFAGSASLQNAILNPISTLTVSAFFTILGIIVLIISIFDTIVSLIIAKQNFYKARILIKSILLSICHISPLYIFCSTMALDFISMIIQYRLTTENKTHPKLWLLNNIICIFSLTILVLLHWHLVTMIVVSIMILFVIFVEVYIHHQQYKENEKKIRSIFSKGYQLNQDKQNNYLKESNVWDINIEKQKTKQNDLPEQQLKQMSQVTKPASIYKKDPFHKKKIRKSNGLTANIKDDSLSTFSRDEDNKVTFVAGDFF